MLRVLDTELGYSENIILLYKFFMNSLFFWKGDEYFNELELDSFHLIMALANQIPF